MKKIVYLLIILLTGATLSAQRPGDLNLDFGKEGIFIQHLVDTLSVVLNIAVLSDGHLVLPGDYNVTSSDASQIYVQKLSPYGIPVPFGNFSRGFEYGLTDSEWANSICVMPDDKIIVSGIYLYEDIGYPFIIGLLPDGRLDDNFGVNGVFTDTSELQVECMDILQTNNGYYIILGGFYFILEPFSNVPAMLMINDAGSRELSFGTAGKLGLETFSGRVLDMAVDSENNDLFVCGISYSPDKGGFAAKFNLPTGLPDTEFGEDGILMVPSAGTTGYFTQIVFDSTDNTLTLFGHYEHAAGDHDLLAYRIDSKQGRPDVTFGISGWSLLRAAGSDEYMNAAILQSDGKYYFGGSSDFFADTSDFFLGRVNHNGSADTSFGTLGLVLIHMAESQSIQGLALSPAEDMLYAAGFGYPGDLLDRYTVVTAFHTGYKKPQPVSISENIPGTVSLFPNPAKDHITIETGIAGLYMAEVLDLTGKRLIQSDFQGNTLNLNIESLQPSVYFIRITRPDSQVTTFKFIKR